MLDLLTQIDRRTEYLAKHLKPRNTQTKNKAVALEIQGWKKWYGTIFGQRFLDSLDSAETDDVHHSDALRWHFESRTALLRGERPPNDWFAYFPTWSRGNLKTFLSRRITICDACLSISAEQPGYALIVGGTKKKIRKTADSIDTLLTSHEQLRKYYPSLCEVRRNRAGAIKSWTTDYIHTHSGHVFEFVGLEEGMAGANLDDVRITWLNPDDIDDRTDSPVIAENNFQLFTTEILPMRQQNTLVFYAQNLISRHSVKYRIETQQARVLTNRKPTQPVPAVRDLVTDVQTIDGLVKDIFISGKVTWRGWNAERVQDEINTYGLPAFKRECQHEVEQDKEGLALPPWSDTVHVISRSQFASIYGTDELPQSWFKYVFSDWARTKTKYHANVAGIVTVSGQNSALPGHIFVFHPMSFPAATTPEDVAERLLNTIAPMPYVKGELTSWKQLIKSSLERQGLEKIVSVSELLAKRRSILARVLPDLVRPILRAQSYRVFRNSHEREDVRDILKRVFGLPFVPANPGADGGLDTLNLMVRVDYSEDNPFKPGEKGLTNFHLVTEDGSDGKPPPFPAAIRPDELHDEQLFRYQMANWRFRDPFLTVRGETEGELLKMNDDFGNGLMMLFFDNVIRAAPMSTNEKNEQKLDPAIRSEAIEKLPDQEKEIAIHSRRVHLGTIEAQQKKAEDKGSRLVLPRVRFRR